MLHEILQGTFDNQFQMVQEVQDNEYLLCYKDDQILLKQEGEELSIPRKKDFSPLPDTNEAIYLFALNGSHFFLLFDFPDNRENFIYKKIFDLRLLKNGEVSWMGVLGYQLMNWYISNQYCGHCGTKTVLKKDVREIVCPSCGKVVYPNVSPAVIVAITSGNKLLMAQNAKFRGKFYSVIAGYVEVGESLEQTVIREVKEETGITIRNLRYYKSQPWPYSASLMVAYFAEADDTQELIPDPEEIAELGWYERGNLPPHPGDYSIAGEMIELFEEGMI